MCAMYSAFFPIIPSSSLFFYSDSYLFMFIPCFYFAWTDIQIFWPSHRCMHCTSKCTRTRASARALQNTSEARFTNSKVNVKQKFIVSDSKSVLRVNYIVEFARKFGSIGIMFELSVREFSIC